MPEVHEGYNFIDVMNEIDITDIADGADAMVMASIRNVISNNFAALVDIFIYYAVQRPIPGGDPEALEYAIGMNSLSKFVRTCRLSSETCSFFEIQRAAVRPHLLRAPPDEEYSLGLYEADFRLPEFLEALIRIASLKGFGLSAICDKVNKLIHTQVLPYATGDDEDPIRAMIQKPAIQDMFAKRKDIRKFYFKRTRLEKQTGARSLSLAEFISCLGHSDQLDEELTPAAVKELWLLTLSFDVSPDLIQEDDNQLEISLSEFEEIITRCVLQKNKVAEENLPQQTQTFVNKFVRFNS